MPAIETVTAPLAILFDNGTKQLAAACFPHKMGLLYLDTWWHLKTPDKAAHIIRGDLKGEGPWRIKDATIRVLGCHNTDPELQQEFSKWSEYLQTAKDYPPREQIVQIAQKLGSI